MATHSKTKFVARQLAIWLLLIALASVAIWFAYATLSDLWLLIIIWAHG